MSVQDTLGRPLRDLRISVTDRCNFRCVYCMPKEVFGRDHTFLERRELLTFEEIERLARTFVAHGVEKIRITGGEPLVRRHLERLIAQLAALDVDLTLTTNGSLLPQKAQALRDAGLRRITVSLDSLDDATFRAMNDVDFPVARVLEGIEAAAAVGLPVKVNMVVKRGANEDQIVPMAQEFRARGHILRFIEYMDVGHSNGWRMDEVVPAAEIVARLDAELSVEPAEPQLPRRGRAALALHRRVGRGRRDLVGDGALLRRLHPDAAVRGGTPLYLLVRAARARPACARPRGRFRRGTARGDRPHLGRADGSVLRGTLGGDGRPAQGRDELHRRMKRGADLV